jgi:Tol biopolymer transport system component
MLARAWAAPLAVLGTLLTTAATPTRATQTESLLYTTYAGSGAARGLELRAISLDGTGARTIVRLAAPVPRIYSVALSPNMETLAAEDDGRISTIALSSGTTRTVASNASAFTWSPDSMRIAYRAGSDNPPYRIGNDIPQIYVVRGDGSDRRRLTHGWRPNRTWSTYRSLAWAPNGRRIAFVRWQMYDSRHPPVGGRIATITMSGAEKSLPKVRPFVPASLAWSRSGTRLAAGGFIDSGVVIVRLDRGRPQYLRATNCCVGVDSLAWSPDGTRLAFLGADTSEGDIGGVIRIGSKRATVFTQFNRAYDPVWARDSRQFAFVGCDEKQKRCDVYLSNRDGREVKRIKGTTGAEDLLAWAG